MRKINKRLYLMAAVITLIIFSLGLLLGMVMEGRRVAYVQNQYREQVINFNSLQVQYLYLSTLEGKEACPAFSATLNGYIDENEKNRIRLENYLEKTSIYDREFKLLKREYLTSQMNYWILSKRTKELCDSDFVTVLYFHSPDCDDCVDQGFVLDYLKLVFGDRLLVFAFDTDFDEEPAVSILSDAYNITETPALIIESNKFVGFQSKDEVLAEICGQYREMPPECESE
jgi:hypothetical protein